MAIELVCPKCHGAMRTYERNAVTVDQCVDCRGIFLDRGELDQLLDAEAAYNQSAQPTPPAPATPQGGYGYEGGHHGSGRRQGGHDKRRKGFLGELFD
jgi:Zn-finger nucleic acid-binding protein